MISAWRLSRYEKNNKCPDRVPGCCFNTFDTYLCIMVFLKIKSVTGYKPRPDYTLTIGEEGKVYYSGRHYVGRRGAKEGIINRNKLDEIRILKDFLIKRNIKNYLKKNLRSAFQIQVDGDSDNLIDVDVNDVVSEDVIQQILELAGADKWIYANLDLFLVMSKSGIRSKELGVLRAVNSEAAISTYLEDRNNRAHKSDKDFIALKIGYQEKEALVNPIVYFSYREYQIQENSPVLFLNNGPEIDATASVLKVYFFISFGKRYNDETGSYFLVLAKDIDQADKIFKSAFPHFMPRDFQAVDPKVVYRPNPLFNTHIPIAIR